MMLIFILDYRKLSSHFYDSKTEHSITHRLRGIGGNLLILEEAAFIDEQTVKEIITPILVMESSCLIAISTLHHAPSNVFTMMMESGLFKVHRVTYICNACLQKGIRTTCKHKLGSNPNWISEERMYLMNQMFPQDESTAVTYLRETMGIVEEASNACFTTESIKHLFDKPFSTITEPVRFVYIAIDPVAGSDVPEGKSDFVIMSIAGSQCIHWLGAEALDVVRTEDYEDILVEHIKRIKKIPFFETCTLVVDAEAGTGLCAGNIEKIIETHFSPVVFMRSGTRVPGTRTSNESKLQMMQLTRYLLDHFMINIFDGFITTNKNKIDLFKKTKEQLTNYERLVFTGSSVRVQNSVILSGKGLKKTRKDDLSVTLQRVILTRKNFLTEAQYTLLRV